MTTWNAKALRVKEALRPYCAKPPHQMSKESIKIFEDNLDAATNAAIAAMEES